MCGKGISPLDNVSHDDFIKIVQDMKPKIGFFGGRYFVSGKKSYTMNQITEKFSEKFPLDILTGEFSENFSPELGRVIAEKNKLATAMLKKANCFQKIMTKIKQKWGNWHFKKFHDEKETMLQAIANRAMGKRPVSGAELPTPPTVNPQPQNIVIPEEPKLVSVPKMSKEGEIVTLGHGEEAVDIQFPSEEDYKRSYYEIAERHRRQGDFDRDFDGTDKLCKQFIRKEFLVEIYLNLAYNQCKEAKNDRDYRTAGEFVIRAGGWNYDDIFLDVADEHLADGDLEKASEVLSLLGDKNSDRAQEIDFNIGMAYIARSDEQVDSQIGSI